MKPLSISDALETVLDAVAPLPSAKVRLAEAEGRVLAADVVARDDVPFDDNSAMDGFAVSSFDLERASKAHPIRLRILPGMVAAGDGRAAAVGRGTALRIMTGAPMPAGADAVVPVEDVRVEGEEAVVEESFPSGRNVRRAGEDLSSGSIALARGTVMDPDAVGIAVLAGAPEVTVVRRPRVAILTSGDELIGPGEKMRRGAVRNSNSWALASHLRAAGCDVLDLGVAPDDREVIFERLSQACKCDAVVTTGGVSMGEKDFLRAVLEEKGLRMKFWGVDMKPGKPLLFGLLEKTPVFGLPGNPVSVRVTFEIFVRPAVMKLMGRSRIFRPVEPVRVCSEIRRSPGRPEFLRVRVRREGRERVAELTRSSQGSGIFSSLRDADGFLFVEADTVAVPAGAEMPCLMLHGREEESFGLKAR